jgi:hypothetical protein
MHLKWLKVAQDKERIILKEAACLRANITNVTSKNCDFRKLTANLRRADTKNYLKNWKSKK